MTKISTCIKSNQWNADKYKLANGLTLIYQHLPATPVVAVDTWVKAGAMVEPDKWDGMAHFLEHMIFKGSEKIPPGEFDQIIEKRGGMTNAATSHDYAHFFLMTSAEYIPESLPHLAEILLNASIPENEWERELDVVLEEIRYTYDDPDWIVFQNLCNIIYQNHPYGKSILGEPSSLMELTPNKMRCFHQKYYQPENMCVSIIGGIEAEKAISVVTQAFTSFPKPSECPITNIKKEEPLQEIRRSEVCLPRIKQARLLMGWLGPGAKQLEEAFALDVLSVVLAGGRISRLVDDLLEEKQLVWDIDSDFSLQQDSSLFTVSAWLDERNLKEVEKRIIDHIIKIQNIEINPKELQRAKRLLFNDYIFSQETPCQLAGLYGYYETIAKGELSSLYPIIIKTMEAKEIQRVANQYISSQSYAISILKPQSYNHNLTTKWKP